MKEVKNRILKIWSNVGSNGGCIQKCESKDCDGGSNECKAWDHSITITPNTSINLGQVFGEHLSDKLEFKITLEDTMTNFENARINPKYIIREMNSDYYMKKTKKICPACIFHTGGLPPESIKLCITHADKSDKNNHFWQSKGEINNE